MRTLHVAAAQIHAGGGPADTLQRIARQARAAAAVGVEVLLFAEGALQGYDYDLTPDWLRQAAEPLDGPHARRLARLATDCGLAILCGLFERAGDACYNSVLVARPGAALAVERKHVLTGGERAAGLQPGRLERTVFEFNGVRCVVLICADTGAPGMYEHLKGLPAEYRFIPTGGGGKIQDYLHEADLQTPEGRAKYTENRPRVFKTEAIVEDAQCPWMGFTSANALGPAGQRTCHQGHCMIVDNRLVMRAQIPGTIVLEHQQDQMIHAELTFPDRA